MCSLTISVGIFWGSEGPTVQVYIGLSDINNLWRLVVKLVICLKHGERKLTVKMAVYAWSASSRVAKTLGQSSELAS